MKSYPESTVALLRQPYRMISSRCEALDTDVFETRLFLRKVICMRGAAAAEVFYDDHRFQRQGAAPGRLQKTLFGQGGVQGLDDDAHRHRKAMFVSLLTGDRVKQMVDRCDQRWAQLLTRWESQKEIVLYDEMNKLLCWAACEWAGVPLSEHSVEQRTRELVALFQYAGTVGPKHWWSRTMRNKTNRWIEGVIEEVRRNRTAAESSPAHIVSHHRNLDGQLLSAHDAAVELINVLRPIIAISVYVVLTAVALQQHRDLRERLKQDDSFLDSFVQEVRRYYPFFPFAAAVVRGDFEWRGWRFPKGRRVLLDLFGTNHDPQIWNNPHTFVPERFTFNPPTSLNFIPQGGGDTSVTHRCPGEPFTVAIMKWAARKLTRDITYDFPPQDLDLQWHRLPALPKSRFIMRNVRLA